MNESLVFELSVDTVDLVKGLATAKNGLEQFAEVGKTSITQLNNALKALEAQAGKSVNPGEIEKLKGAYAEIKTEVARFRKEFRDLKKDSDDAGNSIEQTGNKSRKGAEGLTQVEKEARRSRIAVYGLNQVVRDLPFGFIAISNNLPVLFDQFAELKRETGSNRAAFSALAGSILGAGGASIAFSVLTSLITTSVQKYGSLKGAVDALVLSNTDLLESYNKAKKSLDEFNKSLLLNADIQRRAASSADVEAVQVRALVEVVKSANSTDKQRKNAINGLQKASKEYFGILEGGKFTTEQLNQALSNYQKSLSSQKEIQGFQKTVDDTNAKISEQRTLLDQNRAEQARVNAEINKNTNLVLKGGNQAEIAAGKVRALTSEQFLLRKIETELNTEIDKLNVTLGNYEKGLVDATVVSTNYGETIQSAADASKAQKEALDKEIAVLVRRKTEYKDTLRELNRFTGEYLDIEIAIAKIDAAIAKLKTDSLAEKLNIDIDLKDNIAKLEKDFKEEFQKFVQKTNKERNELLIRVRASIVPEPPKEDKKLKELNDAIVKSIGTAEVPVALKLKQKDLEETQKQLQEITKGISDLISGVFVDLINDIGKGKSAIDLLANAFKNLAKQLAIAIVKFAIFKAIETGLAASTGGTSKLATSGIGDFLRFTFGGGGVAAPRTGLQLGQGGLALSGQVVFIQRGQDLVGVLNQGNARIGRVG